MKILLYGLLALATAANKAVDQDWSLTESKTSYSISHALKTIDGLSTKAVGKVRCSPQKVCEFLIAVPVKSFDSGNSSRDSHMIQTMKGIQHPDIVIKGSQLPFKEGAQTISVEIEMAGRKSTLTPVSVLIKNQGTGFKATTNFGVLLSKFAVERPSLLSFSVKDEVRVSFEGLFEPAK